MAINISALKVELLTDPKSVGYSASVTVGDLNRLADLLNTRGLGGVSDVVSVGTLNAFDLQQLVVGSEYLNLTQPQRDLWNMVITTAINGIAVSNTLIKGQITAVWSAGTTTRTNLVSAQTRAASRAEILGGEGVVADTGVIYQALH